MRHILLAILIAASTAGTATGEEPAPEKPAFKIVNVVDDFLAYHRACGKADAPARLAKWDEMLEKKHAQFFRDAIYRRKTGKDLAAYKADCIQRFFADVSPEIDALARRNRGIRDRISGIVKSFEKAIPGSRVTTDIYVTVSFSFRGKAVTVGDQTVLAIGLEYFTEAGDREERITLAHELFHDHHFKSFSAGGGLYRTLWAEGLATYAAAVVVPGLRRSAYLGFSAEKMNRCHDLLPLLAADLRKNLGTNDHRLRRIYFGAEANDTKVPPEAGYYVGLLIAERLGKDHTLEKLAKLGPKEVFAILSAELDVLAKPPGK